MLTLRRTDSTSPDFVQLVAQLDRYLTLRNGDADAFYAQFNKIDALRNTVVAYDQHGPVGCGAIKPFDERSTEIKRMYVLPDRRGQGIAATVLTELEQWSRELGYTRCVLETARDFTDAVGLYSKYGYRVIPNYGQYVGVEDSVCFEKIL